MLECPKPSGNSASPFPRGCHGLPPCARGTPPSPPSGEVKRGRTSLGGRHGLPWLPGRMAGDSMLGAESGVVAITRLWVLLLLPSLEVSRTLTAQGSADAGDHGDVGAQAQKLPQRLQVPYTLALLASDSSGPHGFDEWLPAQLADCFCLGVLCRSVPTEPWAGAKRALSAPPVLHSDMCSGSSSSAARRGGSSRELGNMPPLLLLCPLLFREKCFGSL